MTPTPPTPPDNYDPPVHTESDILLFPIDNVAGECLLCPRDPTDAQIKTEWIRLNKDDLITFDEYR